MLEKGALSAAGFCGPEAVNQGWPVGFPTTARWWYVRSWGLCHLCCDHTALTCSKAATGSGDKRGHAPGRLELGTLTLAFASFFFFFLRCSNTSKCEMKRGTLLPKLGGGSRALESLHLPWGGCDSEPESHSEGWVLPTCRPPHHTCPGLVPRCRAKDGRWG